MMHLAKIDPGLRKNLCNFGWALLISSKRNKIVRFSWGWWWWSAWQGRQKGRDGEEIVEERHVGRWYL